MNLPIPKWYAVRAVPGSQRMAKVMEANNDQEETEGQKATRERKAVPTMLYMVRRAA